MNGAAMAGAVMSAAATIAVAMAGGATTAEVVTGAIGTMARDAAMGATTVVAMAVAVIDPP